MSAFVPLGDLVKIKGGGTPSRTVTEYWNGEIPWATVKDFKSTAIESTLESITREGVDNSATTVIPPGAIIIPTRMAVGKAAINKVALAINQDLKALLPGVDVDPSFLLHFMLSQADYLESRVQGATVKGIKLELLRSLPFPRISLDGQRRISAILDKAQNIRRAYELKLEMANELLKATYLDMFGDPVLNNKRLPTVAIGELIRVSSGNGLTAKEMDPAGRFPVYGGNGINGYHSQFMFAEPQIVIGRVGVYCGAVHVTQNNSWITDNALYIREYKIPVEQTYLEWALRFANLNQYAGRSAQPLISGSRIYPIRIVLPSSQEQVRFSDYAKQHTALCAKIGADLEEAKDLFSVLSQRAFRGEM